MSEPKTPDQAAAIDALAARLIQLSDSPDESAARAELSAITSQIAALKDLHVAAFSVRAVVAYILALMEKLGDALSVALTDARANGRNQLTSYVIDRARRVFLQSAFIAMHAKRPDVVRAELTRAMAALEGTTDLDDERALLNLLSHVDTINVMRAGRRPLTGRPTVLKLGVWGDRFIDSANHAVLSSLLAPGNAPALKHFGPGILHIHTRRRDVERIRALDTIQALSQHLTVQIEVIPEELFLPSHLWGTAFWNRNVLAVVEYDSLMYARQLGADLVCLTADEVLSDGCLKDAKEKLSAGYEIVLLSLLRSVDHTISQVLESYRRGPALTVPPEVLYRLALQHIHPDCYQQFMCRAPRRMAADPHQVFFASVEGFAAHGMQWHPLALSAASVPEDIGFDSHTIDCRFASDLTHGKNFDAVCYLHRNPPDGAYIASLDKAEGIAEFGRFEVSADSVAQSLDHWINAEYDFDYFEWLLRQRAVYKVPSDLKLQLPHDSLEENQAIADTIAAIERRRPSIMGRIRSYAR